MEGEDHRVENGRGKNKSRRGKEEEQSKKKLRREELKDCDMPALLSIVKIMYCSQPIQSKMLSHATVCTNLSLGP